MPFHLETSDHPKTGDDPYTAGDALLDRAREVSKRVEETVRKLIPESGHAESARAASTAEPPG